MPGDLQGAFTIGTDVQYKKGVLFMDDMEYATPYVVTGTGADFAGAIAAAAKYFGVKGLDLETRTTNPAEDDIVTATIQICYPETDLLVTRMRIGIPDISDTKDVQVTLTIKDGEREYLAGLKYDAEAKHLYYWSSGGAWVEIAGYAYTPTDLIWMLFDMQIDLGLHEYLGCLLLGDETDLAGTAFQNVGASAERSLTLAIVNTALTTQISHVYIDSLYVGEFAEL